MTSGNESGTGDELLFGCLSPRSCPSDVFDTAAEVANNAIDHGGVEPIEARIALESAAQEIREREEA